MRPALVAALSTLLSTAALAQSAGPESLRGLVPVEHPAVLTLDDAFALAAGNSFDLRIADARIAESNARVRQAWAYITPTLSLGGNYTINLPEQKAAFGSVAQNQQQSLLFSSLAVLTAQSAQLSHDPTAKRAALERAQALQDSADALAIAKPLSITIQPGQVLQGALTAQLPLFNGRAIPLLQNAYTAVDISKLAVRQTRAAILFNTARAYYQVVASKKVVDIARQQVEQSEKHLAVTKSRVESGVLTNLALQRSELDVVRSKQQLRSAQGALTLAKGSLAVVLGREEDFDVAEPPPVPALEAGKSANDLIGQAYSSRDDLRLQKQSLTIADRGVTDAWMHLLPTVNLQGQGNFTSNTSGFVSQPFFGSIAIQASVPIFDGGNTYGLIDEANAKVKGELLKMRQLEEQVASQVRGNVDDIVLKRDSVETSKNVAELAKANQENAERLFELGAATQLDVADANLGAFQANLDQARSELDLQVSRLGLAYTIGQFRPVDSTVPAALSSDDEHKARSRADGIKD